MRGFTLTHETHETHETQTHECQDPNTVRKKMVSFTERILSMDWFSSILVSQQSRPPKSTADSHFHLCMRAEESTDTSDTK